MKAAFKIKWMIILSIMVSFTNDIKAQTNFIWGKQFGTDKEEYGLITVTDHSGNVYIAGNTEGILADRHFGKSDAFITNWTVPAI
jgi:hypothetical protein